MIRELPNFGTILQPRKIGVEPMITLGIKIPDGPNQAIRIHLPRDWIKNVPQVECAGVPPWLRTGNDWHADRKTGFLCFDYHRRWTDHLLARAKERDVTPAMLERMAAEWLVTATGFLLHIHFRCEQTGRKEWPSTVKFWEHSDVAAKRQLKLINRKKIS